MDEFFEPAPSAAPYPIHYAVLNEAQPQPVCCPVFLPAQRSAPPPPPPPPPACEICATFLVIPDAAIPPGVQPPPPTPETCAALAQQMQAAGDLVGAPGLVYSCQPTSTGVVTVCASAGAQADTVCEGFPEPIDPFLLIASLPGYDRYTCNLGLDVVTTCGCTFSSAVV
eukprot:100004-Chlamydomonas_euryale.AAC.1